MKGLNIMTLQQILNEIKQLSSNEKEWLASLLAPSITEDKTTEEFVTEERLSGGRVCPICGCTHIVRNGRRKDHVQRYICKDCGKSFVITSNSIVSGSCKGLSVWRKYIGCMINGFSIRKTAGICRISNSTSFIWRHKILDALQNMASKVVLDGIVEADETFFAISYKGNHKYSKHFKMPRKPYKRGHASHVRGLSRQKVCIPCAVNRQGLSIARITNTGRVSTKNLHDAFDGKIASDAIFVTDKMNSYVRFANTNHIRLVQLKGGRCKKGIYNIQHVNNYHSRLKAFLRRFHGVSTKYLNNYLIWHNLVNYAKDTEAEKQQILLTFSITTPKRIISRDIANRPAVPVI